MSLFKKKEVLNLDKASGVIFLMSLMTEGRIAQMQLKGVDNEHELAVRCGYDFALSIPIFGSQIGMNNIDLFIDYAIKNAKDFLLSEKHHNIPEYEKYIRKATNWVLNEYSNSGSELFEDYAKVYLNDLYNGNNYSYELLSIATHDMMFYYDNWKKTELGIKIVK